MTEAAPILVPTDFSVDAQHALEVAKRTAQTIAAPIVLLHVEDAAAGACGTGEVARRCDARRALAQAQRELATSAVPSEVIIRPGDDPAREILEVAASRRVALIVIATHGWTAVSALLLGSVADRVIRHASHPVLVVRHPTRAQGAAPSSLGGGF